jgi:hypothetical protein
MCWSRYRFPATGLNATILMNILLVHGNYFSPSSFSGSLGISLKPKNKENFRTNAMLFTL